MFICYKKEYNWNNVEGLKSYSGASIIMRQWIANSENKRTEADTAVEINFFKTCEGLNQNRMHTYFY